MAETLTGKIADWDAKRGFGFLDHEGSRIFLHIHEYAERHHSPMKGDLVSFLIGQDQKGRVCAKSVRVMAAHSRLRLADFLALVALLILPALTAMKMLLHPGIALAIASLLSWISWSQYAYDKKRAEAKLWRFSEARLHFWDFVGGWPGGFLAQKQFRHKTVKGSFQFTFWSIVWFHQLIAFDYLGDWRLWKAFCDAFESFGR